MSEFRGLVRWNVRDVRFESEIILLEQISGEGPVRIPSHSTDRRYISTCSPDSPSHLHCCFHPYIYSYETNKSAKKASKTIVLLHFLFNELK